METLEIDLSCGATVKVEKTCGGFYLEVRQKDGATWATGVASKELNEEIWDLHYVKGYLSDRIDLAQAFRDVADFIEESRP